MKMDINSHINKEVNRVMKNLETQTRNIGNESIWATLQEIKPKAEEKLNEIIIEKFYNKRQETEWYDRTYQFANCGVVNITQGGGHYVLQVWLDTTQLQLASPHIKKNLWSYGYSYGKELMGTPLDLEEKQQLVDDWDDTYGITQEFEDWFHDNFNELFEKNFNIRMRRVMNYKTW